MSATPAQADVGESDAVGDAVGSPQEASAENQPQDDTTVFRRSLQQYMHQTDNNEVQREPTKAGQPWRSTRKRPNVDESNTPEKEAAPTSSSIKRRRTSSKYAPPSKYAHLSKLTDILEPNLIAVFVGFNPGVRTATTGHAYAHPSNMFWKLLHSSGCTETRLRPEQDVDLPRLCSLGNTNLVERPSKDVGELSKAEMAEGTQALEEKVEKFRPEAVCIVGKTIWQSIWRWRYKREMKSAEFNYGWQDARERMGSTADWDGAWVFVATATSGLSASTKPHEKEAIWKPFGEWVQRRRKERSLAGS